MLHDAGPRKTKPLPSTELKKFTGVARKATGNTKALSEHRYF